MEINQTMLTPLMCEACILRRRKRTSRRKIACCFFIAYNAIVLSVFSVTLWYINDRLNRTEGAIAVLKERSKTSEETLPIELPSRTTKPDVVEKLSPDNPTDNWTETLSMNVNRMLRRKRASSRRRGKKRCKNCLPVVQIEGAGGFGKQDKSDLSDLWVTPSWVNPKDKQIAKYFDVGSVTGKGKIKVKQEGLYFVYAQMTLAGKSKRGYHVKKEPQKTTIASCTNYSELEDKAENLDYMVRPCATMTVLRLEKNDMVYIEEMNENSKCLYNNLSAVFGLIRVGT
ncbi:uncharacterized protein LOC123553845 isoform X3 [Mercenaria mercenaria]|uniref:uncharacterized protein LOC123553845 isoform X3 n=1 Tax=Mercenaria mercenaria TaxID=6596 RepID=UPI00234ED030|nr:uncharacterized protein LOC123553845 isoform X3 [Mercenaria mercenaria]